MIYIFIQMNHIYHVELGENDAIDTVQSTKEHRRRHDSSSDDDDDEEYDNDKMSTIKNERQRHDDSDDTEHDQDQIISTSHISHSRGRHDSSSGEESNDKNARPNTGSHNDSDSRHRQRKRHDSSDSSNSTSSYTKKKSHRLPSKERMSSGHKAGIQTSSDFTRREGTLRRKKLDETNAFARQNGAGGGADTIYRDRQSGQKLEVKNRFIYITLKG